MSYRRTINLKTAGLLETSNVEVRIVIRFWSVKVSRRWGFVGGGVRSTYVSVNGADMVNCFV
jgi:hypothetical protein